MIIRKRGWPQQEVLVLPALLGVLPPHITPQNSPSKFLPQVKSTPANDLLNVPDLSSNRKRNLPPRPPSPLPGVSSIGVSVISPNPYPHSQGSQDQLLEWDNFVYSLPTNLDSTFVVNDTIEGVQNINLVPNNSIPIVDRVNLHYLFPVLLKVCLSFKLKPQIKWTAPPEN